MSGTLGMLSYGLAFGTMTLCAGLSLWHARRSEAFANQSLLMIVPRSASLICDISAGAQLSAVSVVGILALLWPDQNKPAHFIGLIQLLIGGTGILLAGIFWPRHRAMSFTEEGVLVQGHRIPWEDIRTFHWTQTPRLHLQLQCKFMRHSFRVPERNRRGVDALMQRFVRPVTTVDGQPPGKTGEPLDTTLPQSARG